MSKTKQNELICLCGEEIVTDIILEVKESRDFSILADEVRDCSNTEQMPFVIWFLDRSCKIREKNLLNFQNVNLGHLCRDFIWKLLMLSENLGLEIGNLRGQGYDGAGNMAEKKSGVSS